VRLVELLLHLHMVRLVELLLHLHIVRLVELILHLHMVRLVELILHLHMVRSEEKLSVEVRLLYQVVVCDGEFSLSSYTEEGVELHHLTAYGTTPHL